MTDEEMKRVAELYNEISATAEAIKFFKNCAIFRLTSGSQVCDLPKGLQYLIQTATDAYYKELKEKQEEL